MIVDKNRRDIDSEIKLKHLFMTAEKAFQKRTPNFVYATSILSVLAGSFVMSSKRSVLGIAIFIVPTIVAYIIAKININSEQKNTLSEFMSEVERISIHRPVFFETTGSILSEDLRIIVLNEFRTGDKEPNAMKILTESSEDPSPSRIKSAARLCK